MHKVLALSWFFPIIMLEIECRLPNSQQINRQPVCHVFSFHQNLLAIH
jgi:hypothetical protein